MATSRSGKGKRRISGAGSRLKAYLERHDISVRSFQQQLAASNVRGSAYSSVWSYLEGRVEPPMAFLEAAARELNVRIAWLAFGEGDVTEAAQEARTITKADDVPANAVVGSFIAPMTGAAPAMLNAAWKEVMRDRALTELVDYGGGLKMTLGRHVWDMLQHAALAPLETLGELVGRGDQAAFDDYVSAVLLAIRQYARAASAHEREADDGEA